MIIFIKNIRLLAFIEIVISFVFNIFYRIFLVSSFRKNLKKKQHYFSVCAIFKDEERNLKEWIEYHLIVGVEHFYLYNNNSTDNYLAILSPYLKNGLVTLIDWKENYSQTKAYENCYAKYGNETTWLGFIDLDEFICPKYEEDVKKILQRYEGYPALFLYWKMFGTAGIMKRNDSKLLIEQFTTCWEHLDGTGKYIVCTDFYVRRLNVHSASFHKGRVKFTMVNEYKKWILFPQIYMAPVKNTIWINHYWSKSFEEYRIKMNKPSSAKKEDEAFRRSLQFFYQHEKNNISEDKTIFRFITKLKIRIFHLDSHL